MRRDPSDRGYHRQLQELRDNLLVMGANVEEMLSSSMRALQDRDTELAERTIRLDRPINRLEMETDDLCLRILARRQPLASDLRFITMALKLVTDLERIGDLGVNVCERVIELNRESPLSGTMGIVDMADAAQSMLREALDAFVDADVEAAERVIARDNVVDAYYQQVFREILAIMLDDPNTIQRGIKAQSIAKYLERIGDHATNIAEMVVFMVRGKDIRHSGKLPRRTSRPPKSSNPREQ